MTDNASSTDNANSTDNSGSEERIGATSPGADNTLEKDPSDWVSGGDPMTEAQKSYLDTLAKQAGEELPADMSKAEASQHIDRLRSENGMDS
jgi:hypothetical protein